MDLIRVCAVYLIIGNQYPQLLLAGFQVLDQIFWNAFWYDDHFCFERLQFHERIGKPKMVHQTIAITNVC